MSERWAATECLLSCQRALTRQQTLLGGSALEIGDLRLFQDGGERGGALGSDVVFVETADEGRSGVGKKLASMSTGLCQRPRGGGALEVRDHRLLENSSERGGAFDSDAIAPDTARDG